MRFSSVTAGSICDDPGFKAGDRVKVGECGWRFQDGRDGKAYGRILGVFPFGMCYVEFDMGAMGRLTLPIDKQYLEPDLAIPTLAENQARLREKQRAVIEADRAQAARIEREVMWERDMAVAWGKLILGNDWEPQAPVEGQANTSGIKQDFEAGGLTGDSIW